MSYNLVIVESPTKARTIRKFLPKNEFVVEASMGHVRDLPESASQIPKRYKEESWAQIGVNYEDGFAPIYVTPKGKSKILTELRAKMKKASALYLATDEDREGESIAWHLVAQLKPKIPVYRMVFHEITKSAILGALKNCREIDQRLVRAQETRRILDRLVGYTVSPLLWKKIAYGLSAGRVQSVGLRLCVEREHERIRHVKSEYWDLDAKVAKDKKEFQARLTQVGGKKVAASKDFDENTGKLKNDKVVLLDGKKAKKLKEDLEKEDWTVKSVEEKPFQSHPAAPFITSTLQQESNRKLHLSARDTMRIAQRLYEEGLITYMRTDSPNLSSQAIAAARSCVEDLYGKDYLSKTPRQYKSKSKGAQEAHEAIRPAGQTFVIPKESGLTGKELALYELIWKRTVATQMAEAQKLTVTAKIETGDSLFQASGTRIMFPGFLRAYVEGHDDPDAALGDKEVILPDMKEGQKLDLKELKALSHETKPPARFTEASLIKVLESEGIGRPSTYASIISTILNRGYVTQNGNALVPTYTGMAVVQLLSKHFTDLVDYAFTSKMEESLDEIAEGKQEHLPYLEGFYLGAKGLKKQVEKKEKDIDADESRAVKLPQIKKAEVRIGRYGAYLVQEDSNASIPMDVAPADLDDEQAAKIIQVQKEGPKPIGEDPETGEKIYCLTGRFGPYVQLGEVTEEVPKPKRASVPKNIDFSKITIEQALKLLSLPRKVGVHPKTNKDVEVNRGRFGPYILHDGEFRSLKKDDDVYTVTLERCLEILAEEKKGRRGSKVLKELGQHPKKKKKLTLLEGKYGPYIKMGTKNFTIPKDESPDKIDLNRAVQIVEGKA